MKKSENEPSNFQQKLETHAFSSQKIGKVNMSHSLETLPSKLPSAVASLPSNLQEPLTVEKSPEKNESNSTMTEFSAKKTDGGKEEAKVTFCEYFVASTKQEPTRVSLVDL